LYTQQLQQVQDFTICAWNEVCKFSMFRSAHVLLFHAHHLTEAPCLANL